MISGAATGLERGLTYALITPARNEARHLDGLIRSVLAQTLRPVRWVIVSDGSTDGTDEIVTSFAREHPWIQLLRLERESGRSFSGKARAVNAAYASLRRLPFDLVGNLDADITVPPDFYEFLVGKFRDNPELGVAGTPFVEDAEPASHSYDHAFANLNHVSGACQVFRRQCFEDIGGYTPLRKGGIDWVAVTTARLRGWTTRTFVERTCAHHRAMGTADRNRVRARFRHGQEDFEVGSHPVWHMARCLFQMRRPPVIVGGVSLMCGYTWAWLRHRPSPIPKELREFHRSEQRARLRRLLAGESRRAEATSQGESA
jgi:glycosyltransferase involved in cell wall biosynthesis